ncbi:hypothetical protein Bbelb_368560 [Branchiostoma belcheri]|nr:hypothetical protein Bbelb_368560 [Branchiostoma belcheri]
MYPDKNVCHRLLVTTEQTTPLAAGSTPTVLPPSSDSYRRTPVNDNGRDNELKGAVLRPARLRHVQPGAGRSPRAQADGPAFVHGRSTDAQVPPATCRAHRTPVMLGDTSNKARYARGLATYSARYPYTCAHRSSQAIILSKRNLGAGRCLPRLGGYNSEHTAAVYRAQTRAVDRTCYRADQYFVVHWPMRTVYTPAGDCC